MPLHKERYHQPFGNKPETKGTRSMIQRITSKQNLFSWIILLVVLFFTSHLRGQVDSLLLPFISPEYGVNIRNASTVNSPYLEFSPTPYLNGIVFASSRQQGGWKDQKIEESFFQLYYAEALPDGGLLPAHPFSPLINSHLHEGPAAFNAEGNIMYFTRNNLKKGVRKADHKGIVRLKIYEAKKGAFDWEDIRELPFNDDDYSSAHPTTNTAGDQLFFSSDRPGGLGGMDLYFTEKKNGIWSEPVNLGSTVNTSGNELFPFFLEQGLLFFASDGHPGHGGLDLFVVDIRDYSKVWPLSESFNSFGDDLGLVVFPGRNRGYFASTRPGGLGKDDIYLFELDKESLPGKLADERRIRLQFIDIPNQELLENVELRIFEESNQGYLGLSGQLYESRLLSVDESSDELVFKLVRKDAGALGPPDRLSDVTGQVQCRFQTQTKYLLLVNKEGYQSKELLYSLSNNPGDSLILIDMEPISCTPYKVSVQDGKTKEALPGALLEIESSCPNEQPLVLESGPTGEAESCLSSDCNFRITAKHPGYKKTELTVSSSRLFLKDSVSSSIYLWPDESILAGTNELKEGVVIVLNNIYYDFNKSSIRVGAARELDELAEIMKRYPDMEVELVSHTDSRGNRKYNQELSERRSRSAMEYLVANGVGKDRIKATGKGESQIRNRCKDGVDCEEEEHQFNRRTEVRVTRIDAPVDFRYRD
jgi:outer membrane protein OmpA-like peptidoglycan-associated protein